MGAVEKKIEKRHAVVLRMFNDRSSKWKVTDDRVDALVAVPSGLEKDHVETIADMVDVAVEGAGEWGMTTERFVALRGYIDLIMAPTAETIRDVIRRVQLGGLRDGVADRGWFVDAMKILLDLEEMQS